MIINQHHGKLSWIFASTFVDCDTHTIISKERRICHNSIRDYSSRKRIFFVSVCVDEYLVEVERPWQPLLWSTECLFGTILQSNVEMSLSVDWVFFASIASKMSRNKEIQIEITHKIERYESLGFVYYECVQFSETK